MLKNLKSRIISRLKGIISYHVPKNDIFASPARCVRYFVPMTDIEFLWGTTKTAKEICHYKKHFITQAPAGESPPPIPFRSLIQKCNFFYEFMYNYLHN